MRDNSIHKSDETYKEIQKKGTKTSNKSKKTYDLAHKKSFDEMKIN